MNITEKDIIKVADLAKINISPKEIEKYKFELEKIFSLIEKLKEVKIDEDLKIHNFAGGKLYMREDEIIERDIEDKITSNASKTEFNCFVVPKIKD